MCGGEGTAMCPVAYAVMRGRHGAHRRGVSAYTARAPETGVHDICGTPRRRPAANEKMRIVLDGLRGEERLARRCRRERINPNVLPMSPA